MRSVPRLHVIFAPVLRRAVDARTRELLQQNAQLRAELTAQRVDMERQENSRRAELSFVTEHAAVMLAHCDRDTRFIFVNRGYAERFGATPESVLGKRIPDVIGEQAFRTIKPFVDRTLSGERVEFEIEIPYETLQTRFMHCIYVPDIDTSTGKTLGFVAAISDITDRRRLEEQLREADRRKDEFLAVLAHELRNPLAPIRNAVHFLKVKASADVSATSAYDIIDRQTTHLTRLVDDLLEVSRITGGRIQLQQSPVNLSVVITNAVDACAPLIDAARQQLTVKIDGEHLSVMGDLVRLSQVITNLLNNANKYTPAGGRIDLRLYQEGENAVISVADTGVGIPPKMSGRIFEMFVQLDQYTPRARTGLGVGLALSQRLVELHGGTIEVESAGKDRGSTFRVRLPLLARKVAAQGAPSSVPAKPLPETILIADDNPDVVESLRMILTSLGSRVHVAHDGEAALAIMQQKRPQAAILDIGMPGLNGYEVASAIRQLPEAKSCLLIALTGWGQDEDRKRAHDAGFDIHLTKPVDPNHLLAALARNVSR
jgi:PAS domain S-box-containing protein